MTTHIQYERELHQQIYYDQLAQIITQTVLRIRDTDMSILDVGCGNGEIVKALTKQSLNVTGLDIDKKCLKKCSQWGTVRCGSIFELDSLFKENSYDVVICSHVLEHLEDPIRAVEKLKYVSAKWIIIIVPNLSRWVNIFVRHPQLINKAHIFGWDAHHLKTFLEVRCDLKICQWVKDALYITPLHKSFLARSRILRVIEYTLLPFIFPLLTDSLIVVCEKNR